MSVVCVIVAEEYDFQESSLKVQLFLGEKLMLPTRPNAN